MDSTGTLNITSGLDLESDILLNPTGNVGINVNSAAACVHVNYDLFLQKNNSPDNTTTPDGLYFRYQSYQDTTPEHGLIASGNNSTMTPAPLYISASQVLINPADDFVGISTTTPRSQLSVGGNMSIGSEYAAVYSACENGLIVEGSMAVGTYSTSASFEAFNPTQDIVVRSSQKDETSYGLVIGNMTCSTTISDGLRGWTDNIANAFLESFANAMPQSLHIQPSAGKTTIGSVTSDAQLTITQPSTSSVQPAMSIHQLNNVASFAKFTGTAVSGNVTNNLVLNDFNVTAAIIQGFIMIQVSDTGGMFPTDKPLFLPVYTLT